MKRLLLATVAIAALGATVPALAADLGGRAYYSKAPPAYVAPMPYNWNAFYIGANAGGAFSSDSNFNGLTTGNNGGGRFLGGFQVGADFQFAPNWVAGIEGQYSWLSGNVGAVFPGMRGNTVAVTTSGSPSRVFGLLPTIWTAVLRSLRSCWIR